VSRLSQDGQSARKRHRIGAPEKSMNHRLFVAVILATGPHRRHEM
jgi:hypothetical protein